MQIYDGNLLHILKPMTRKTRERREFRKKAISSLPLSRRERAEIEADYRRLDPEPAPAKDVRSMKSLRR